MCVQLVVVSLSAVFARAIYTAPFVSFDQDFAVAPLHPAGREFRIDFFSTAICHRRRPLRQRRRRHHRRRRKRRRRRCRRRCYLHILNASTSATIGTVRSSVRLQEHHHPFKHDVKFLSFDSDDSGLARSAYFMGAWRIRYHCTVIDSLQHAQWLFGPEKNSFHY